MTTDKRSISYDYCVLATGSEAALPSYASPNVQGVFVYRNIADLEGLLAYAGLEGRGKGGKVRLAMPNSPERRSCSFQVAVIGGGLLGLEAAKAAYDLETISTVTIVNRRSYPPLSSAGRTWRRNRTSAYRSLGR